MFPCLAAFEDTKFEHIILPVSVRDEILLVAVLLPFAGVNLRAPLRSALSISDASEQGGGAAEATAFVQGAPEQTDVLHCFTPG